MGPYLGLAFLLILIAVEIASQKAPEIVEEFPDAGPHEGGTRVAVRRAVAQQALPLRRGRPVLERGGAGVRVDVPDRLSNAYRKLRMVALITAVLAGSTAALAAIGGRGQARARLPK
jgi:hypothetical protein